mmetsp:Transcript_7225/g.24831  ORF Transcript_7225/g.24831 Transcript_7225/m.24831 type:complete len:283 (-) Transcript_7225:168-1016(-)
MKSSQGVCLFVCLFIQQTKRLSEQKEWRPRIPGAIQQVERSSALRWTSSEERRPRLLEVVKPVLKVVQGLHFLLHGLAGECGLGHRPLRQPPVVVLLPLKPDAADHQERGGVRPLVVLTHRLPRAPQYLALLLPVVPALLPELLSLDGRPDVLLQFLLIPLPLYFLPPLPLQLRDLLVVRLDHRVVVLVERQAGAEGVRDPGATVGGQKLRPFLYRHHRVSRVNGLLLGGTGGLHPARRALPRVDKVSDPAPGPIFRVDILVPFRGDVPPGGLRATRVQVPY